MTIAALFFSADGRIGQGRFFIAVVCLIVLGVVIPAFGPFSPALWLIAFYSWICVQSKRLHDIGRSGWLQALPFLLGWALMSFGVVFGVLSLLGAVAGVGGGFGGTLAGGALIGLGAFLAGGTIHLLLILWLGFSAGQTGFNRYGPEPRSVRARSL